MADILGPIASAIVAVTFGWSGLTKLLRPARWRAALEGYDLGPFARAIAFLAVPVLEFAIVVLVAAGISNVGGALAVAALASFSVALLRARRVEGDRLPCGCFGGTERRDYRALLARNVALLVPAAVLLVGASAARPQAKDALPVALVVIGVLIIGWMASQVMSSLWQRGDR